MVYSLFSGLYEQAIQPCCYVRRALYNRSHWPVALQVIARGRDLLYFLVNITVKPWLLPRIQG